MIYHETTYVNPAIITHWFTISVINRWDFTTKPAFYKNGLSFCLKENTAKDSISWEAKIVEPTEEQKAEIRGMGYFF